ncbi:MAG: hypothetical protein H5T86_16785, partial [Armatimonadetes bacterium]|nr:hypothetical protein [Armatimonadota bacterium]
MGILGIFSRPRVLDRLPMGQAAEEEGECVEQICARLREIGRPLTASLVFLTYIRAVGARQRVEELKRQLEEARAQASTAER